MQSMSSARQSEVKAWEEEIIPCEHTLTIEQLVIGPIPASGMLETKSQETSFNAVQVSLTVQVVTSRRTSGSV